MGSHQIGDLQLAGDLPPGNYRLQAGFYLLATLHRLPLLDAQGNVIGITVASFGDGQNLNLFIPINDALRRLNVSLETRPEG